MLSVLSRYIARRLLARVELPAARARGPDDHPRFPGQRRPGDRQERERRLADPALHGAPPARDPGAAAADHGDARDPFDLRRADAPQRADRDGRGRGIEGAARGGRAAGRAADRGGPVPDRGPGGPARGRQAARLGDRRLCAPRRRPGGRLAAPWRRHPAHPHARSARRAAGRRDHLSARSGGQSGRRAQGAERHLRRRRLDVA